MKCSPQFSLCVSMGIPPSFGTHRDPCYLYTKELFITVAPTCAFPTKQQVLKTLLSLPQLQPAPFVCTTIHTPHQHMQAVCDGVGLGGEEADGKEHFSKLPPNSILQCMTEASAWLRKRRMLRTN